MGGGHDRVHIRILSASGDGGEWKGEGVKKVGEHVMRIQISATVISKRATGNTGGILLAVEMAQQYLIAAMSYLRHF